MLDPLRAAHASVRPLRWRRGHDSLRYVLFKPTLRVHAGVGCVKCNQRSGQMPITRSATRPHVAPCLECLQQPERYLRPRTEVFDTDHAPPRNQDEFGRRLMRNYRIAPTVLILGVVRA